MTPETPADEGPPPSPLADAATLARLHASYVVDPVKGCWVWQGELDRDGYGRFWAGGRKWLAHRFSYELHCGPVPEGLNVLHECDNRPCCNWDHLRAGTQRENLQDAKERGRLRSGPGSNPRKLTGQDALTIQGLRWFGGLTVGQIAAAFGVCAATVKQVLNGQRRAGAIEAHVDAVLAAEAKAGAAAETPKAGADQPGRPSRPTDATGGL